MPMGSMNTSSALHHKKEKHGFGPSRCENNEETQWIFETIGGGDVTKVYVFHRKQFRIGGTQLCIIDFRKQGVQQGEVAWLWAVQV